jgi:hypothetical protein
MDLCCLTRVELQLPASEFPPTCALFLLSKAQPNNAIVNPPPKFGNYCQLRERAPAPPQFTFFHTFVPPLRPHVKCQNFTILQESKILQFYKCQKFYNSTSVKNFTILQVSKNYHFQAWLNHRANACTCYVDKMQQLIQKRVFFIDVAQTGKSRWCIFCLSELSVPKLSVTIMLENNQRCAETKANLEGLFTRKIFLMSYGSFPHK